MKIAEEQKVIEEVRLDRTKFGELYKEYSADVYRYIYSITLNKERTEDLVSQAFLRAYEKIDSFQPRGVSIKFWFFSIARNLAMSGYRKEKWLDDSYDTEDIGDKLYINSEVNNIEDQISVDKYLSILSDQSREIVTLKIWQELTFEQIAELISEAESMVKAQFYRALEKLRRAMEEDDKRRLNIPMIWLLVGNGKESVPILNLPSFEALLGNQLGNVSGSVKISNLFKRILMSKKVSILLISLVFLGMIGLGVVGYYYMDDPKEEDKVAVENKEQEKDKDVEEKRDDEEVIVDEEEVEEEEKPQIMPPIEEPEVYTYTVDVIGYDPGTSQASRKHTIVFQSSIGDLKIVEEGKPGVNLVMPEVGFTRMQTDDTEVRIYMLYEGYMMSYKDKGFKYVGENAVINGSIGRHINDLGRTIYSSNVSLESECQTMMGDPIEAPCGGTIISFTSDPSTQFTNFACNNDPEYKICDEIVLNIKDFRGDEL